MTAAGSVADFGLIETLRWSPNEGFARLDAHLARLARSAAALGFQFSEPLLRARLDALAGAFRGAAACRVRIQLARSGLLAVTSAPLDPASATPMRVMIASHRIDPADPLLRHKTTLRARYDAAGAEAAAMGCDEPIFLNSAGALTEAARFNIFLEGDGVLLTPPLSAGLLPGVLRQTLLEAGEAIERSLAPGDLRRAARWFLGNSLRGLRPARLV